MTKQEFLDTLRRALNRELNEEEVEDNIAYYEEYFRGQMAQGHTEEEIIAQLGDPRLIARTILQVDEEREERQEAGGGFGYSEGETVYTEMPDGRGYAQDTDDLRERGSQFHVKQISGWKVAAVLIGILLLLCVLIGTAVAVVWKLLPVIVIIGVVLWLYHRFFS
jgi:hypothetical protein